MSDTLYGSLIGLKPGPAVEMGPTQGPAPAQASAASDRPRKAGARDANDMFSELSARAGASAGAASAAAVASPPAAKKTELPAAGAPASLGSQ